MRILYLLLFFLCLTNAWSQPISTVQEHAITLDGIVRDSLSRQNMPFVNIILTDAKGKQKLIQSSEIGTFKFTSLPKGVYALTIRHIGYRNKSVRVHLSENIHLDLLLVPHSYVLKDIVVTASESQGLTSASRIDRKAMEHLQPSSFTDLLALLPGGKTKLPTLTQANTIKLRQAGDGDSNYDFSSLGTLFVTDGIPMSNNNNMQLVKQASTGAYGDPDAYRNHANKGVDMRTISTDNIEKVEVVRGIASAEYGDLTSGVVIIHRKLKETPWEARFKADSYSKLLYFGKGFKINDRDFTMNASLDYLDAKRDPRTTFENYKRLTGSLRFLKLWHLNDQLQLRWQPTLDYTGSFDDEKTDAEIMKSKEDAYSSSYNKISLSSSLALNWLHHSFWKSLHLDLASTYEVNRIEQDKLISLTRDQIASTSLQEGEHDGVFLPYKYLAEVTVDGKPLSTFAKLKALGEWKTPWVTQRFNAGLEWRADKNFGQGQVYDPFRPITPGTPYRPRVYRDIPAQHILSAYLQDHLKANIGRHQLQVEAGVRALSLLNLPHNYLLQAKVYLDPRLNMQWTFPSWNIKGRNLSTFISGGFGKQTKFPTLMQLYPDKVYQDIVQLNYYHMNPDFRRVNLYTFVEDATNPQLAPARNKKWEIRLGGSYNGHHLSVTYFHEHTRDGFRYFSTVRPYQYKAYDETSFHPGSVPTRPELNDFTYRNDTILGMYSQTTNGSSLKKQGVEFQYSSRRIKALRTRFTINGAWFKTTYSNSQPMFYRNTSQVIGGIPVNDKYIGYYQTEDGMESQSFNTNFMADTYLPRLGLSFSLTAECTWLQTSQQMFRNGVPLMYMDVTGQLRPYTEADRHHAYKQWLVQKYNPDFFLKDKIPFYALFNLKVTKSFGDYMKIALFIDRILDYMPDYTTRSGLTVRRTSRPYFGVEMNLTI